MNHLASYLDEGLRYDGRKKDEMREIKITSGVSKTAEGSAMVEIGNTKVIAGVKMDLTQPYPDRPDEGGLMVSAELLPLSSPEFEPGPPKIDAIELARVVDRGIRECKAIDAKKLCVTEGEKAWFVTVDICTINADGNLLDAAGLAAIAAIRDAKFPTVSKEGVIDYKKLSKNKLPVNKEPVPVTVWKVGEHLIVDPTRDEEKHATARLTITCLKKEACSLQKGGDEPLSIETIDKMVGLALKKSKEMRKAL